MPTGVSMGGMCMCSFGMAPSALVFLPLSPMSKNIPLGTMTDITPIMNIPPFAMCTSMLNPTVIAATAAAMGVLTPMPCIPQIVTPWLPSSPTVMFNNKPALSSTSKAMCAYGGVINIIVPSTGMMVTVP